MSGKKTATRIISWNVNGIRSVERKGALDWFLKEKPEILCIQETKAQPDQVPSSIKDLPGYHNYFNSAEKKGYSGVAVYTKEEPLKVQHGLGLKQFDMEGRVLAVEYERFILFNVYFPNGKASPERLQYKMDFYEAFLKQMKPLLKADKGVIVCGDVNTAHTEIDLARPKENATSSGFLPEERAWIDRFLATGFVDTLREYSQAPEQYSWWDYKTRARERNVGWRIDYFYISKNIRRLMKKAFIRNDIMGSDHCPIGIDLEY